MKDAAANNYQLDIESGGSIEILGPIRIEPLDDDTDDILYCDSSALETAKRFIHCVNLHDDLVAALANLEETALRYSHDIAYDTAIDQARAALAKARGEK